MLVGQSGVCFLAMAQQLALHGCLDWPQSWGTWTAVIFCQVLGWCGDQCGPSPPSVAPWTDRLPGQIGSQERSVIRNHCSYF